jgi:hypothetical protein
MMFRRHTRNAATSCAQVTTTPILGGLGVSSDPCGERGFPRSDDHIDVPGQEIMSSKRQM